MHSNTIAFFVVVVALNYFVCFAQEQDEEPLVISVESRPASNLQKLKNLLDDCNSESIIRAIRRPNIVSKDAIKLRICLSLFDFLQNPIEDGMPGNYR